MLVYRITNPKHTKLDGEGARIYGGRWNHPGHPLVYAAESRSLAILETRVHLTATPKNYLCLVIEIPFEPDRKSDEIRAVRNWKSREKFTKDFGSRWCQEGKECVPGKVRLTALEFRYFT